MKKEEYGEWKRLKAVDNQSDSRSSKDRVFELNGNVVTAEEQLSTDERGDWFNWHALERYLARLKSLVGDDSDTKAVNN